MVNIDQFLELADTYAEKMQLAESTVSTRIFNDGKRLRMLRDGNDVGIRKVEDAVKYFSENWPEGVAWPKRIPRPVKADQ